MEESFFNEFPAISTKEWKQQIQFDLKGLDYNDQLIWRNLEGINIKPFYNYSDSSKYLKVPTNGDETWKITQIIYVADTLKSNKNLKNLIKRGIESIVLRIPNDQVDLEKLLSDIDLNKVLLQFKFNFLSFEYIEKLINFTKNKGSIIHTDIIGNLLRTGNWYNSLSNDYIQFEAILKRTKSLSVDLALYQNAGGTIVQQLAYGLSHINEYYNHIEKSNINVDTLKVHINVSVGSNYFFEIAKLRALRILIDSLSQLYSIQTKVNIHASPTNRNKTLYDYNNNMLRTTTECMSASLGGADYICNIAYDSLFHKSNEFGERISRNQLLILKHESFFHNVKKVANGTYYINALTEQFADKSLALFKDIEKSGGFLKAIKEGTIQKKIKESAQKEQDLFNEGEITLVGTNIHKNKEDRMANELELFPFIKKNIRKTLIEPIIENRLSEKIEQLRLKSESENV